MRSMKRRISRGPLAFILIGILLWIGLVGGAYLYYAHAKLPATSLPLQFSIKSGMSLRAAAQQMASAGILRHPETFVVLARVLGESANLKAGTYEIDRPVTPLELLRKITKGDYAQTGITFVEGWTFKQMRKALDEHHGSNHDTRGLSDAEIMRQLGSDEASPEGWFFPDTYYFSTGTSDLRILRRDTRLIKLHLAAQWEKRTPDLPLASAYEALVLASIIEKETGRADERPLIAAVFINRL